MKHIIGLSGGKDSTALALRLAEVEPRDYEYICTPVGNELEEMVDHLERIQCILGKRLLCLKPFTNGDGLRFVIEQHQAIPNRNMRFCTRQLKIEPTIAYLKANTPCVQYVGLRADEEERAGIYGNFPGVAQRYPLREWGWGEAEVWSYLKERGVTIPRRTDCAWCYGQRIGEWYRLYKDHPERYAEAVAIEEKMGHTFRSAQRDSWPAPLAALAKEFERRIPRGETRPGMLQLDLFEQDEQNTPCRVCSL